ncbi:MAG: response regulator transcription factor [Pseudomonadota bacterium]
MGSSILVVEDNLDIAQMVVNHLETQGHIMDHARDGLVTTHLIENNQYDLIILDLSLPGIDGLALCEHFRNTLGLKLPIIMLTARDTLDDKIAGLHCGADDYLVKPFSVLELAARVQSLLRRYHNQVAAQRLRVDDLEVDVSTLSVTRQRQSLNLTPIGFKLLSLLMRSSPSVVSRTEIERHIWGEIMPDSDTLRSHMYALRKAIDKPFTKKLIKTHQTHGYQIVA